MFYFPLASTQVWGAGLSGCPLVKTGIARVRRARLGVVMMIKQPGSRGLQRKTRGEGARGVAIPLGQIWLAREESNSHSRTSPFRRLEPRVLGITTREQQAFAAPEDKIDRGKGVLEGGRRGGTKGQGSGYLN